MATKKITRRAAPLDIELEKGSDFETTLTWKYLDADEVERITDLTGCTAEIQIRENIDSETILFRCATSDTHEIGDGLITLGGLLGTIHIHIASSLSEAFTWDRGVWSLEITLSNGYIRRLVRGKFRALDEITR